MLNLKFISGKFPILALMLLTFLSLDLQFVFAKEQLFEGDGSCIVGNIGVENNEVAKNKARERALDDAIKKAGFTVESVTEMKNNMITKDEIKVVSRKHLRMESDVTNHEFIQNEDAIKYTCHVKVWIDTDEVVKDISGGTSREKIEDQAKMNTDREFYLEQNEAEIVELRQQYKNASTDNQRQEIAAAIKHNEDKFTATQLYQRGAESYGKGNLDEAIKFYNQAIQLSEKYAAPWTGLGWVYNDQKQYESAIACFQKAIAIYDQFAVPYNGLSYAYNYYNNYSKAIEYGGKAVQIDPKYAAAWNNIGLAYNNLGQFDKAIENYSRAISINANDDVPLANIGNVYYKQKNFAKALEYYQRSTSINSNHPNVWYNLGNIYGQNKDMSKAIDSYKKAASLDPQNYRVWFVLGYSYNTQKNFEDAKRSFTKALKINSGDARAWAGLGYACDGLGDYSDSYEAYKKAVEIEPTNETYKKNLELAKQKL